MVTASAGGASDKGAAVNQSPDKRGELRQSAKTEMRLVLKMSYLAVAPRLFFGSMTFPNAGFGRG
jgi:hypothetical protein